MTGLLRSAVAETIATLLFVFIIITAINTAGGAAAFAIGFGLMVLVYAFGHISGAQLNPAVSLGVWLRGKMTAVAFVSYVVAQLVGGALGALLSLALFPRSTQSLEVDALPAFLVELVFTFILVTVVLNVATSKDNNGNSFYGFAIGATVFVGAITVGSISGGGFNPAVAISLAITGQFGVSNLWIYILAPLVGAALAALVFRLLNAHDLGDDESEVTVAEVESIN